MLSQKTYESCSSLTVDHHLVHKATGAGNGQLLVLSEFPHFECPMGLVSCNDPAYRLMFSPYLVI